MALQAFGFRSGVERVAGLKEAGRRLAQVRRLLEAMVRPGLNTLELDRAGRRKIEELQARPAFLDYHGFPASVCVSVNEEVVHGIPRPERLLRAGDIVSIDVGLDWRGYYSDTAFTVAVGEAGAEGARLIGATRDALDRALAQVGPGACVGEIGAAISGLIDERGFSVAENFTGHGIGRSLHEEPVVPNVGRPGEGPRLKPGMALAIEPIVNAGGPEIEILEDGWTAVTRDRRPSAHFEHTVLVTEDGMENLTA